MSRAASTLLAGAALLVAAPLSRPAAAQAPTAPAPAPSRPDVPSPPHERLAFFEGTWTVEGMPPERRHRERCAWMEGGRRHVVCRTRALTAEGQWRESYDMFSREVRYVPAPPEP